jgi:hypothetical protein
MRITQYNKEEWRRMSDALEEKSSKFYIASELPEGYEMEIERWDKLQAEYRRWLVFGEVKK